LSNLLAFELITKCRLRLSEFGGNLLWKMVLDRGNFSREIGVSTTMARGKSHPVYMENGSNKLYFSLKTSINKQVYIKK
jgi:hypothetical protein